MGERGAVSGECGRVGEGGAVRGGDNEFGRLGDNETGGELTSSPCLPLSPSPRLPVSPSPPLSSQPISTHFEGLSLYLIALTIRLLKISPTLAWSARTVGSGRGRRISTPLSRNRGAIISSVSLTTSSRATSCMTRSARPTREK